jgi:hypothetical protein
MKKFLLPALLLVIVAPFILPACSVFRKDKELDILFTMERAEGFVPSRQTAIWLEKPDGSFVKTLFVSEYMAYGGYLVPGICPDWVSVSDWKNVDQEEFDAVTGATPQEGSVEMEIKIPEDQLPDGEYLLLMEIHLTENFNLLARGKIRFSGEKCQSAMKIEYLPEKYHKLNKDYISDIKVICK